MVQTSKNADMLVLPTIAAKNQLVPHPIEGTNNRKLDINQLGLELISGKVCDGVFILTIKVLVSTLKLGIYSALRYHKNLLNERPLTGPNKTF